MSPNRRDFLKKVAAAQAGLVLGGSSAVVNGIVRGSAPEPQSANIAEPISDVIVVGAGVFGDQLNGMPAGQRSLSPDPKQLEQIRIAIWSNR
jgi:hypothetical protein